MSVAPIKCIAHADVLKRSSSRIVRHKLVKSHVEALQWQRRLQQRVCVKCKPGEATEEKGNQNNDTVSSIGFGAEASLDEWGSHAETEQPASVFQTCILLPLLHCC